MSPLAHTFIHSLKTQWQVCSYALRGDVFDALKGLNVQGKKKLGMVQCSVCNNNKYVSKQRRSRKTMMSIETGGLQRRGNVWYSCLSAFIECKINAFFYPILIGLLMLQSRSREGMGKVRLKRLLSISRTYLTLLIYMWKQRFQYWYISSSGQALGQLTLYLGPFFIVGWL